MKIILPLLLVSLSVSAFAEDAGFERYRVIIQNAPFGPDKDPVIIQPPTPPPDPYDFTKDYRISMLREKDGQVLAGLVKNKTNESLVLELNETHPVEGLKLVSVDIAKSEIMLQKSGQTRTMKVEAEDFNVTKKPSFSSKPTGKSSTQSKISSFRERMEQRRKEMAKAKAAGPKPPSIPRR